MKHPRRSLLPCLALTIATRAFAAEPPAAASAAPPISSPSAAAPKPPEPAPRLALAVFTESAVGFAGDGFYNQLTGLRLDYRTGNHLVLGFGASYANLKGPEHRVSNVLPVAMLGWEAPLSDRVCLPVRFATGYLPKNGPWLKAALGLGYRFNERTRLTFEALAPALWIVHDSAVGSLDAAVELSIGL